MNWQAYLDGSMSAEERRQADQLLRESAEARAELEALRSYLAVTKAAFTADSVPVSRLQVKLSEAASEAKRTPLFALRTAIITIACAGILFMAAKTWREMTAPVTSLDVVTSPQVRELMPSNATQAAEWTREYVPFYVPVVELQPKAQLVGVHLGERWACFDYQYDSSIFHLAMTDEPPATARSGEMLGIYPELQVREQPRAREGIAFCKGSLHFYLKGGNREQRLKMIDLIVEAIGEDGCESPDVARTVSGGKARKKLGVKTLGEAR